MELTVRICVSLKWEQEETIEARSRFKRMRGQDMEDQFGQELGRGTPTRLVVAKKGMIW